MATKPSKDHLGKTYLSISAMCRHYNISVQAYKNRLKKGFSLQDALEKPNNKLLPKSERTDHLGNIYESVKAMSNHYGIPLDTYKGRINRGWSIKKALTKELDTTKTTGKETLDHLGNKFNTLKDMCNHYNVTVSAYLCRMRNDWSLKDALTIKQKNQREIYDHKGNIFNSTQEMCQHWNMNHATYLYRQKQKYPLSVSLGDKPILKASTKDICIDENLYVIKRAYIGTDNKMYFYCIDNEQEIILSETEIYKR